MVGWVGRKKNGRTPRIMSRGSPCISYEQSIHGIKTASATSPPLPLFSLSCNPLDCQPISILEVKILPACTPLPAYFNTYSEVELLPACTLRLWRCSEGTAARPTPSKNPKRGSRKKSPPPRQTPPRCEGSALGSPSCCCCCCCRKKNFRRRNALRFPSLLRRA